MVAHLSTVTFLLKQLKSIAMYATAKSLLWAKQTFNEYPNKPHRMLMSKLNPRPFHSYSVFQLQPNNAPTHCPQSMVGVFGDFDSKLYNCLTPSHQLPFNQENVDCFLADFCLSRLSLNCIN